MKLKTRRGAAKRFKKTGNGIILSQKSLIDQGHDDEKFV